MTSRVVVDAETDRRTLSWRGLYFEGDPHTVHAKLGHADGSALVIHVKDLNGSLVDWVWGCSVLVSLLKNLGTPTELHSIEDPDVYVAALDAYEAEL